MAALHTGGSREVLHCAPSRPNRLLRTCRNAALARLCADMEDFSLDAAVRCDGDDRQALEQPCRNITRLALANERVQRNTAA